MARLTEPPEFPRPRAQVRYLPGANRPAHQCEEGRNPAWLLWSTVTDVTWQLAACSHRCSHGGLPHAAIFGRSGRRLDSAYMAEMAGVVIGVMALVVAIAGIVLLVKVERLKRPRLEIEPSRFRDRTVPHTFATVRVFNRPNMPMGFGWLARSTAEGCEVTLEFRKKGIERPAFPSLPARWSSRREPITEVVVPAAELDLDPLTVALSASSAQNIARVGRLQQIHVYSPALAAESRRWDLAASNRGEEGAVAILRSDGHAYAWGAESQAHPNGANPEWELDYGTYEVTVRVQGSDVDLERRFTSHLSLVTSKTSCSGSPHNSQPLCVLSIHEYPRARSCASAPLRSALVIRRRLVFREERAASA